jgi:hypothetical protein
MLPIARLFVAMMTAAFCGRISAAQMNDFSNRSEGTWSPHADADMQLLGVIRSRINFAPNSTLRVHFFLPPDLPGQVSKNASTVSVDAREIIQTRNYYMHSKARQWQVGAWNDFGPWPTADFLDTSGIQPANLAVLASCGLDDGSRVYLPVEILVGNTSASGSVYTLQFSTAWNIHALEKTLTTPSRSVEQLPLIQCAAGPTCVLYGADSAQSFSIDMTNRPEGVYKLHLVGHVPNDSFKPELSIQLYHRQTQR